MRATPKHLWMCHRKLMVARRRFLRWMEIVGTDFTLAAMRAKCQKCPYRGSDECTGMAKFELKEVRPA